MSDVISHTELCAGQRADFKVFYRKRGKLYFDVMWASSAAEAETKFKAFAREARWSVDVLKVRPIQKDA